MTFKREKLNSPYCQPLLVWVFRKLSKQTRRQFVFPPFDAEKHGVRSAKETKHSLKANRASDQDSAGSASKGGKSATPSHSSSVPLKNKQGRPSIPVTTQSSRDQQPEAAHP